jgi:hypothetical protein
MSSNPGNKKHPVGCFTANTKVGGFVTIPLPHGQAVFFSFFFVLETD